MHPKGQCELMRLLLSVAKKENIQFFFETHSEHVLHVILNAIGKGEWEPSQVAIYSFENVNGTAKVNRLEVDEQGGVKGGLPGFFDQSLDQYLSVVCTDNQFVTVSQTRSDLAKVTPAFSSYLDYSGNISICQAWKYQQRSVSDYSAVTSPVTTLLVSGSFDPLTAPDWARQASTTLSNGYWVEFPGLGHDEGASNDSCPQGILSQFLLSPGAPDTSCVQSMSVAFAAPAKPATVVINAQRRAGLTATKAASLGLAQTGFLYHQMAMHLEIENRVVRRHIQRRMAELTRLAR